MTMLASLMGTVWQLDSSLTPSVSEYELVSKLNFTSNGIQNTQLWRLYANPELGVQEDFLHYNKITTDVYTYGTWADSAYRYISIAGGRDVTDYNTRSFFDNYAIFRGLLSGIWKFKQTPIALNVTWSINFTSNQQSFTSMSITASPLTITYSTDSTSVVVYQDEAWTNDVYRSIDISGGDDIRNQNFVSWMQSSCSYLTSPSVYIKASNTWVNGNILAKVDNEWKDASAIYIKTNNTWTQVQ